MRDISRTDPRMILPRMAAILALSALVLAGCGRRGAPELPNVAAEEEAQRQEDSIPVPLPGERKPKPPEVKPKGHFLLDPLL
jgi:predicted small lipoprotein YifL